MPMKPLVLPLLRAILAKTDPRTPIRPMAMVLSKAVLVILSELQTESSLVIPLPRLEHVSLLLC